MPQGDGYIDGNNDSLTNSSLNRPFYRSASPAKRNAEEMEGETGDHDRSPAAAPQVDGAGGTDIAMSGNDSLRTSVDTQDTLVSSIAENSGNTSFTSVNAPRAPSAESSLSQSCKEPYTTEETDAQFAHVMQLINRPMDEGQLGVLISTKWLSRVVSRTTEGLKDSTYPKESREGDVGPVDNADILPVNAYDEPIVHDLDNKPFIALRPGLQLEADFQIVPEEAYNFIIDQYGCTHKEPIVRYVHNTAPEGAISDNFLYEIYPPVITIRKVPQTGHEDASIKKPVTAVEKLRMLKERAKNGQRTAEDAVRLVTSRTERVQKFLARAKQAAGIARTTKVRLWRLMDAAEVSVDKPDQILPGVLSPPPSRDATPTNVEATKLIIPLDTFNKMDVGKDIEAVDVRDETGNDKYNGKSTMEIMCTVLEQTILLEEQIGGPAGGEFQSDTKKSLGKLLNRKNVTGSKPGSTPTSGRTSPAPGIMTRGRARRDGRTRGTVGLSNLGNTCYMNSALQCIRSVEELAVYFLSGQYKSEINNDNPLGHHGAMAKSYANVLQGIYGDSASSVFTPSAFKKTISGIQPLFSGYGQQDSQEFLSFLVDALHEDLNRIIKKPYNENPDSDDKTVHDPEAIRALGEIYRKNHKARNDSIAMDLFNGFYKNTMECPTCEKVSITFDPYSLLTVQLPVENTFQHNITFLPIHGRPVIHELDIDKNASIKTVKEWVARKHPGVDANRLWMVEIYSHKPYKVFEDFTTIAESSIQANDHLFMFELDAVPKNRGSPKKQSQYSSFYNNKLVDDHIPPEGMASPKADVFAVPVMQRQRPHANSDNFNITMHPLYITVTREEAKDYDTILKKILIAVSRTTSRPILSEFDEGKVAPTTESDVRMESEDEITAEDTAGVSDHSAQSEDGYVNVSMSRSQTLETPEISEAPTPNADLDEDGIPQGFMDPQYFLSPALRNHLFEVKYSVSAEKTLHCAGYMSLSDSSVKSLFDRVPQPVRRSSVSSSASNGSDATSVASGQVNGEEEESDADDMDAPDITLGGEAQVSSDRADDSDDNALPSDPIEPSVVSRHGRRKNAKKSRKHRANKLKTYGGGKKLNRNQGAGAPRLLNNDRSVSNDSPYYIQLGELIVLDWTPEAIDALYGGDSRQEGDMRGFRTTDDNGSSAVIPIFTDPEMQAKKAAREKRKRNGMSLEECFAETGKREILSEDNAWYCNRCKEMRRAAKTLEIWTIPEILVVHLKRFGGTRSFRDKLEMLVEYPIEGLDMSDRIGMKEDGKEYIYDLFAVDNHYGGLGGGHYTAQAKSFYDELWYDYNDGTCSKIGQAPRLSAAAYLLFYRRRSSTPLGPPALQELVETFRNPPTEAEEVDDPSGEDKLGDPTRPSLHGSSSASTAVAAGVMNRNSTNPNPPTNPAAGGQHGPAAPQPVVPRQTPKTTTTTPMTTTNSSSISPYATVHPSSEDEDDKSNSHHHVQSSSTALSLYAARDDEPAWSFDALDDLNPGHSALSHGLLNPGIANFDDVDDDNDSTRAQNDLDDRDDDSGIGADDEDNDELLPKYRHGYMDDVEGFDDEGDGEGTYHDAMLRASAAGGYGERKGNPFARIEERFGGMNDGEYRGGMHGGGEVEARVLELDAAEHREDVSETAAEIRLEEEGGEDREMLL